ncbi:MAG: Gfo/Idh/MocA family oxidoreductase [Akkermansiaceae bacterium]|nr:Gfo/Idh/MocA family oxidoreductase [Akkermansiaceae bacterium]
MKRRSFLKSTSAAVLAGPTLISASALGAGGATSANNRIGLGLIGCGGQGSGDLFGLMNSSEIQALAVCDPDKSHQDNAKAEVEKRYAKDKASGVYKGCQAYGDFRELCARKDIDAVIIGTPDHWHALAALEALRNGKDVYCEKPITHLFAEGQILYREVAKRKAIFQTGSQQRSNTRFRVAAEAVLNGLLGKIQHVEVGLPTGNGTKEEGKIAQEIPAGLDYNTWCGPSRLLPYHKDRLHWNWRWCLDFGGGQLMDWIGHHNDIAHWGLGLDQSGPIKVEAKGFLFPESGMYDNPINYEVLSHYAAGYTVSISNKHQMGAKWIGENGWIFVDRGKLEASNKEWITESTDRGPIKAYKSNDHRQNFIEGIRTRKECICPAETAHRSITPGHLGYVSQALGRALKWDPAKEEVIGDAEADALLKKVNYRGDWKLG